MRHMMFMHGMAGGFAGFFLMHMIRRLINMLFMLALIAAAIYFFARWQKERQRNRMSDW